MFDLYILPLHINHGKIENDLPGLFSFKASKRAQRSRINDILTIQICLNNNEIITDEMMPGLLDDLANVYYRTPGTITAGIRGVADSLNQTLLNHNLNHSKNGVQVSGLVNIAVLRKNSLFIGHVGPTHTLIFSKDKFSNFSHPGSSKRGVGLGRSIDLQYFQTDIEKGDLIVFCSNPPESWRKSSDISGMRISMNHIRQSLIEDAGDQLKAALIQFQPGTGEPHLLKPKDTIPASAPEPVKPVPEPLTKTIETSQSASLTQPEINTAEAGSGPEPQQETQSPERLKTAVERASQSEAPQETAAHQETQATENTIQRVRQSFASILSGEPSRTELKDTESGDVEQIETPPPVEAKLDKPQAADDIPATVEEPVRIPRRPLPRTTVEQSGTHPMRTQPQAPSEGNERTQQELPKQPVQAATASPSASKPTSGKRSDSRTDQQPGKTEKTTVSEMISKLQTDGLDVDRAPAVPSEPGPILLWRKQLADNWKTRKAAKQAKPTQDGSASTSFFARLLPQVESQANALSPSTMLFIAILVPLLIVAIATTVYLQRGRNQQHKSYIDQALQSAAIATAQDNLDIKYQAWVDALENIDLAEQYGSSEESETLRSKAQQELDSMDHITRLLFQEALPKNGLSTTIKITRMTSNATEVYMLDDNSGRVIRMFLTNDGYELDPYFNCGPGPTMGKIIDLDVLPTTNNPLQATVAGVDANGTVTFCIPGENEQPFTHTLIPPDMYWGQITAMTIEQGNLYILDEINNGVWLYVGDNLSYSKPPQLFFNADIPVLANTIDLAVNSDDLYLLHRDGGMTTCTFRTYDFSDTTCVDPALFSDPRPGKPENPETFTDAVFTQLEATQPPGSSIYILDSKGRGFYHFTQKLALQQQIRPVKNPDFPIPASAPTAFTITPNRIGLLAFGNRIYYAQLP
jgi:hypothetical protein